MSNPKKSSYEVQADDLTWREQEVLTLLAERLSNREIADRLHLAESTVKDYVGKILSKLYVKNRRQAVVRAKELQLLDVDQKTGTGTPSNLPAEPTPFIGRKDELAEISQILGKTRLLTLTGPGGIGKTRLALKAAGEASADFKDGSFFVPLAPIRSIEDIIQTIAEAVGFPLATNEDPQRQLLRYLQRRQLLLVMDNFEHLLDGMDIIREILLTAPEVKILATSREKLNLQSETNLNIRGLSLPEQTAADEIANMDAITADAITADAIALFVQSAGKVRSGFEPSSDELAQITKMCQIVQGMPLAIELAASWLHILSVNEITEELEKGLDILAAEVRDAPERHRSIRGVFDYSWSLLNKNEQEIFMLLTVFRGGFTRAAAQQVAGATLQQLAGLVNKSFLSRNPISGRLEIHELLRQYGQDQLGKQSQASASAHEAHAAYYAAFMHERWEHLKDNRQMQALAEIEADIENVRAAWQFYLDQKNAAQMDFFLNSFWIVYLIRGWNHAAAGLFGKAQEALSELLGDLKAKAVHAIAMAMQGFFLAWLGLADQGYPLAKESVEILEQMDNPIGLVFACNGLSLTTYYLNRSNEEKEAVQKVLQVARASDDKWLLAFALYLASQAAFRVKDYGEAKELAEASLKIGEELGEVVVSAWPLTALGQIAFLHGELEKAKEFYLRCLDESRKMGYRWAIGNSIKYLGQIALLEGDEVEAEKYFIQSLKIAHELGLDRDITNHLFEFARLRVAQARPAEAVEIIGLLLQQPASHQARLGEGRIRDSAKALLAKLEDELSAQSYSEALTSGQEFEMDAVIMRLVGPNS